MAKLYTISNHILLLPSEPHRVRLLVKSDILKLSGSPQNLFQQMKVCDSISERLFAIFAFVTSVNCMNKDVDESYLVIATCDVMQFTLCYLSKNNFAIILVENNNRWCNLSPCSCIDTQSYGEKAIYPKRACYHGFVSNFIKDFYRYMSIDYNSIDHMIVFDMLFRAVNILSHRLSIWYSRYSEANSVNSESRFLNSFLGFWQEIVWLNWERTKNKIHYYDRWMSWIRTSWYFQIW